MVFYGKIWGWIITAFNLHYDCCWFVYKHHCYRSLVHVRFWSLISTFSPSSHHFKVLSRKQEVTGGWDEGWSDGWGEGLGDQWPGSMFSTEAAPGRWGGGWGQQRRPPAAHCQTPRAQTSGGLQTEVTSLMIGWWLKIYHSVKRLRRYLHAIMLSCHHHVIKLSCHHVIISFNQSAFH